MVKYDIIDISQNRLDTMIPLPNLRWRQKQDYPPVLEQAYRNISTGEIEWRVVETVYD